MAQYEYGFEIESILKQFFSLIDKAIILRYEKVENERRLVQTITPFYKFATKSRALLLSLNAGKNFALPCVVVQVKSIKADKERLSAKNAFINRYENGILQGYKKPTPISISVTVTIITKYKTDLFQIYGKLAAQFQPQCFISWMVPTNIGIKGIEELRNKVEWDFNIDIDSKETLKEQEQDRFTGTMSFDIQGWIFNNPRECHGSPILDIGTTALVTNELENRIDGLVDHAAPLVSAYGETYKNPREWATAHVRVLKAYTTVKRNDKDYHFRISENTYNEYKLKSIVQDLQTAKNKRRQYYITFDGYNLSKAQAFLVPKEKYYEQDLTYFTYDHSLAKVQEPINKENKKPKTIAGIPLEIISQSNNTLTVKLPVIDYKGNFDIIVYDEVDYDTLYNAEGFYLKAIK